MKSLQRLVVATLLAVWCFPAVSVAGPPLADPKGEVGSRASSATSPSPTRPAPQTEKSALAAREKEAPDLQNFKGGGVYIYLGGGATLLLVIILLILLV
jgi:hypothetical protein